MSGDWKVFEKQYKIVSHNNFDRILEKLPEQLELILSRLDVLEKINLVLIAQHDDSSEKKEVAPSLWNLLRDKKGKTFEEDQQTREQLRAQQLSFEDLFDKTLQKFLMNHLDLFRNPNNSPAEQMVLKQQKQIQEYGQLSVENIQCLIHEQCKNIISKHDAELQKQFKYLEKDLTTVNINYDFLKQQIDRMNQIVHKNYSLNDSSYQRASFVNKRQEIEEDIQKEYQQVSQVSKKSLESSIQRDQFMEAGTKQQDTGVDLVIKKDLLIQQSSADINQSPRQSQLCLSQLKQNVAQYNQFLKHQYYPKSHPNPEREKEVFTLINELYNQSWRKRYAERNFQYFIRDKQPLNELYKNYGIRSSQMKSQLSQICNSFRQARGDGNCFYTAFGVQFFSLILNQYTEQQFNEFIEKMDKIITFNIKLKQQQMEIRDEQTYQLMWQEFKFRLQFLRNIKEVDFREQELINHYAAFEEGSAIDQSLIDGCFYGLATIFLRNLAYYLIQQSEFKDQVFDQYNLLIWEEECNNNEIIILELSKFLQVNIKLLFFDNGSFTLREYSQGLLNQIILLIRPGHYNVGYFEQDQNIY